MTFKTLLEKLLQRKGEQLKTNAIYDRNLLQDRNS